MASYEAKALRAHLQSLKGWVEHWKADQSCNLARRHQPHARAVSCRECAGDAGPHGSRSEGSRSVTHEPITKFWLVWNLNGGPLDFCSPEPRHASAGNHPVTCSWSWPP
jgi:hypothetical protein